MCIITRWFSRLTTAKRRLPPTNPLDELQIQGLDVPEAFAPTIITLTQRIYQLALDIPAHEEEFRKIQVSPCIQDVLMADIPILLLLDNVLDDGKWSPKGYYELVSTFERSLQHIHDIGQNIRYSLSLTPDQSCWAKTQVETNLTAMKRALQAFLLQKSPQDKLLRLMNLYQQRLQQLGEFEVDSLRDNSFKPGSSRSPNTGATSEASINCDQISQPATPVSPSSNTSFFDGANGAIFRGNPTFSAVNGSPVTFNATNSYIYFMQG
ncbi:hypothetical protein CPB83DRAFT_372166 [Crepidotus variabilis]|uniref:Uncharacterized protein n=1 Tax=Crepidotus variabilis TaxID=179855 RepID=A0A9P6JPL3_9AGAR|nr:hypothetical protein CPB83DRAFT_372166 [Crepidotus variabilis]